MCEMACQIIQKKQEEKRIEKEQAAKAQNSKILVCYDDDDDYSAITPNEPVDSLSMRDEHLDTIPATKLDEFIKSCVETLVPNPCESEGENSCDVPACFTTFSNILFDAEYESDSSDYQSCSDEDFPKEIFSNPLFEEEIISTKINPHHFDAESDLIESLLNRDSSIISSCSKIDSLLNELPGELTLLKSIPSGIDGTDCHTENEIRFTERLLYDNSSPRPPEEFVYENSDADIESFSPSPIPNKDSDSFMKEINLFLTPDDPMPPGIEDDDYDSERDILIPEELPSNYSFSLPVNESFHFDIPAFSRPPAKPPDGNTRILNIKMMGDVSDQKGLEICKLSAKCPMMIHGKNIPTMDVPLFHFYPLDQLKYGGSKRTSQPANKILGMQIHRDRVHRKIRLSQKIYVKKILQRFNMQDYKPISILFPTNVKLSSKMSLSSKKERMEMSRVPYASAVRSLMFMMIYTRPDIAHAVGVVSQYIAKHGRKHWEAVKRILRYIEGTLDVALCYGESGLTVKGYVDSDYAAFHLKTKHIRVQYHFVREKVEERTVDMQKIHTDDNVADYMTKVINCDKFIWCRSSCDLAEK
nr:Gag-Pol polyprotein [Tanacetum cinerariifolium]